jgi:poly(A) polymerase
MSVNADLNGSIAVGLLSAPLPSRIISAITDAGGEARFVGGMVRDAVLLHDKSDHPGDIDMATTLHPDDVVRVLKGAGLRVIPTGIAHGTVTVVAPQNPPHPSPQTPGPVVELTTLREDITTDGRHAEVRFGTDWTEDARRRDFTINSMSLDHHGKLHDPFGGLADLKAGIVRFVGDAETRIREDYLRIMRFFRFYSRFGKTAPDAEAMQAITLLAEHLDRISGERMGNEMRGIMAAGHLPGLKAMMRAGVDRLIAPGGFKLDGMQALVALKGFDAPMLRLGFIIAGADRQATATRLRLSRREARQLALADDAVDAGSLEGGDWQQQAWPLLRSGEQAPEDLASRYAMSAIRQSGTVDQAAYRRLNEWHLPVMPLGGDDIRERGVPAGEGIGVILRRIEAEWAASGFQLSRDDLLKKLDDILATE